MSERTIIIAFAAAALFIVVTMIVFMVLYRKKANKRLKEVQEGSAVNSGHMMSPVKFFFLVLLVTVVAAAVLLLAFAGAMSFGYKTTHVVGPGYYADVRGCSTEELENSPFSDFKGFGSDIKGYVKYTKQEGDIICNYYLLENKSLRILPPALFAIKYTGDKEIKNISIKPECLVEATSRASFDGGGNINDIENCLYAVNINDMLCGVELSIELFDYDMGEYIMNNYESGAHYEEMSTPPPFEACTLTFTGGELFGEEEYASYLDFQSHSEVNKKHK